MRLSESPFRLSDKELELFEKNGYFGPFEAYRRDSISSDVSRLRAALQDRSKAVYEASVAGNLANYDRHLDVEFLARHIQKPEIVDRVRSVLGDDVLCWRTEFFVKYPGDEGTDWHQSRTLAIGGGTPLLEATVLPQRFADIFLTLSVWTALTDSTLENGCLQVIPGTQRYMHYDESKQMTWRPEIVNRLTKNGRLKGFFGYDSREIQRDRDWCPAENLAVSLEMSAGQSVMLWEATMHGSLPNTSKNVPRMAFVARYVPTSVRIYPNMTALREYGGVADLSKWRAVSVSGTDIYRHNKSSSGDVQITLPHGQFANSHGEHDGSI